MRIDIRTCDDGIAVYKDGKCVWNGHSCSLPEGLDALGIPIASYTDLDDVLDDSGNMPDGSDPFPEEIPCA